MTWNRIDFLFIFDHFFFKKDLLRLIYLVLTSYVLFLEDNWHPPKPSGNISRVELCRNINLSYWPFIQLIKQVHFLKWRFWVFHFGKICFCCCCGWTTWRFSLRFLSVFRAAAAGELKWATIRVASNHDKVFHSCCSSFLLESAVQLESI